MRIIESKQAGSYAFTVYPANANGRALAKIGLLDEAAQAAGAGLQLRRRLSSHTFAERGLDRTLNRGASGS